MKVFILTDGTLSGNCNNEDVGWQAHICLENMRVEHRIFYHSELVIQSDFIRGINQLWSRWLKRPFSALIDRFAKADRALFAALEEYRPDMILAFKAQFVRRETVREIRRRWPQIKLVNCTFDNVFLYPHVLQAAGEYDRFYIADTYVVEKMRRIGCAQAEFLDRFCCPQMQHPLNDITEEERTKHTCDLSIVGSLYPYRSLMLESLRGLDLRVYGNQWGFTSRADLESSYAWQCHQGKAVSGREKLLIFNLTRINLTTLQPVECITSGNSRVHQTAACRAFQLAEYNPDLERGYKPGEELAVYRNRDELRELAQHYLAHPEERERLTARAYDRALREHTGELRLRQIFSDLGLQ